VPIVQEIEWFMRETASLWDLLATNRARREPVFAFLLRDILYESAQGGMFAVMLSFVLILVPAVLILVAANVSRGGRLASSFILPVIGAIAHIIFAMMLGSSEYFSGPWADFSLTWYAWFMPIAYSLLAFYMYKLRE